MSSLRAALDDYLRLRRQLGYKLEGDGRQLGRFVSFLDRAGATAITTELAVAWAKLPVEATPHRWRARLGIVRGFATYLQTIDPRHEVPPKDLLPGRQVRVPPYLYSPGEIAALMAAARAVTPPLVGASLETLIGVMAATGVRIGEALALDRDDVDLTAGTLLIRAGKYRNQRLVPLHDTTVTALGEYSRLRDRYYPCPVTPAFLLSERGGRLYKTVVYETFPNLIRQIGLDGKGHRARPRPHDLRHYADGWVMRPVGLFGPVRVVRAVLLSA